MWSPHLAAKRRTSGPENFQSSAKKDFVNTIGAKRPSGEKRGDLRRLVPCPAIGLTVWTAVSDTQFHRFPRSSVVSLYNDILALEPGAKFRITADFTAYDAVADREGKCHDQKFSDSNCGS